jgi:ribonucleoside-diphosphate reductase subunit M1
MSADRGLFVDQSQSLNLFFEKPDFNLLHKAHFYGWKRGLKTGSYYIRSKPATSSVSFTLKDDEEDQDTNDEISESDYNSDLDDEEDTEESEDQDDTFNVSDLPSMGNDDCEMCGA